MKIPPPIRNFLRASGIIRFLYYDCRIADIPVFLGIGQFKSESFKQMNSFLPDEELRDRILLNSIYGDIKKCYYRYRTTPQEYFLFELRHKTAQERREYLSDSMIMKYAAEKSGRRIHDTQLNDKYNFYKINKQFFNRRAMRLNSVTAKSEFIDFALAVKRIIAKPNKAALGSGVDIFTVTDPESAEKVYSRLIHNNVEYIIEEVIRQSADMAVWNESSVNTIRVNSFLSNGNFNVLCPFIRTGRKGSIVDNGGQGGIFASIDKENGRINTPGMDERGNIYTAHPDSGLQYLGWQVPDWEDLIALTEEVHRNMPGHVYVSWDFAHTDNGWVLIEGNWGEFVAQQMTNKRGFKQDFLKYLNAK